MNYEVYHIPTNFTDAGRVIGDFTIPSICSPVMKQARVSFKLWLFRTTA